MKHSGADELERLRRELAEAEAENARLRCLLGLDQREGAVPVRAWTPELFPDVDARPDVDGRSSPEEKVAVFQCLFAGRRDVYAVRWENPRTGKAGWSPAVAGGWSGGKRGGDHLPLTDETVVAHLSGAATIGLYPLMVGDSCQLLVCDFDGATWPLDALAYLDACTGTGVPAALERSRSGDGAHVWVFFSGPVAASSARRLGAALLREAMSLRAELDLVSYDRMFPAQDFVPRGSYGNLIALPLQGQCRRRGTTVFLDPATLEPWPDQWAFLSTISRVSPKALEALVESMRPVDAGPERTRFRPATGVPSPPAPATIRARAGAMLAIERIGLPPALLAAFKHLASLSNPVFYEKERLRLSTHGTPRFVRCYDEDLEWLRIPRALAARAADLAGEAGSTLVVESTCGLPEPVAVSFTGRLDAHQAAAVADLAGHDLGVLVAPPGTGKTVMACALIAHHRQPTLVVVDRKPLVDQWRSRLQSLLGLDGGQIGQLGGRTRASGVVDLAMAQSLTRRQDVAALTAGYGLVVVDECHHIPAVTFERCVKRIPVLRWIGLTATPYRRDGLEGIITMHCGPVRHQIDACQTPTARTLRLQLVVHETTCPPPPAASDLHIQDVFRGLVENDERNHQICRDVVDALGAGRKCLVLTQWTDHLDRLREILDGWGHQALVLRGGMGKKARAAVLEQLAKLQPDDGVVLLATGSYLGEGFDCPALDTLFLAFPLAFKGRIVQYVGRVIRIHDGKADVLVHDYVDTAVPVLARMHTKRLPAFASLGFPTPAKPRRKRHGSRP